MLVVVPLLVRLPTPRQEAASDQVRVIQAQLIDTTRLQADQAEAEAKRQAEAEAKRQAEAEAKRQAEAEAKRQA
ncbi:MAG: hypothetical protein SV108_04805, partial [Pseudomonadota bacterium]|nr:hypothetical protein [Pseudomonadota bacterium]